MRRGLGQQADLGDRFQSPVKDQTRKVLQDTVSLVFRADCWPMA